MRFLTAAALAVVVAVAAAAVTARTAGTRTGTHSIQRITYGSGGPGPGNEKTTQICLNQALTTTDKDLVTVGIKMEDEVTNYPADDFDGSCATVAAAPPGHDMEVKYTLAVTMPGDDTAKPENTATVAFTFLALTGGDTITCGARSFKRTTIPDGGSLPDGGCLNADAAPEGYCYEEQPPSSRLDEGCQTIDGVSEEDFQYCQAAGGSNFVQDGDAIGAQSLAYTGELTLMETPAGEDKDVIVVTDDVIGPQVLKLAKDAKSVTFAAFQRSAATYTACPVEDQFTAYTIDDLDVLGTYEDNTATTGKTYYQFGFRYPTADQPRYQASSELAGQASSVTVNCGPLTAGDATRCYAYLPSDGAPLTLSYLDGAELSNTIIINLADINES